MEQRLGHDFGRVRVHADSGAADSARSIQARAYTSGRDIVFGAGQYSPRSDSGRRLPAHGLAHVARQGAAGGVPSIQRQRSQEEEEARDEGRRDRRSTDRRRDRASLGLPRDLLDDLDSDWAGRMILGQYLYGDGKDVDVRDKAPWTTYMTRSMKLRRRVWTSVVGMARELVALGKPGSVPIADRFHATFENGEGIIGYQYLHGTNKDVGDFLVAGFGEVTKSYGPAEARHFSLNPSEMFRQADQPGARVDFELSFVWNDKIDSNAKYTSDKIKSGFAEFITLGGAESYRLSIGWRDKCSVWLPADGGPHVSGGYPSL